MTVATTSRIGVLRRQFAAVLEAKFAAEHRSGTAALDARLLLADALGIGKVDMVNGS